MALKTQQLYTVLTEIMKQILGDSAIEVVDTNSFVAMGTTVLSSQEVMENFCNTLVQRITRTIISYRKYNSVLKPLVFGDIEWGGIVQKLKADMPTAMEDAAYDLKDGESVDMYIIMKPKVKQKFFVNRTPYSFGVTIQSWQLKRAFLSESDMNSLITAIFGEIQNSLELAMENLGYLTMGNFIANIAGTEQEVKLITRYNNETGAGYSGQPIGILNENRFLRFAISEMLIVADDMRSMRTDFNLEGETRHTPYDKQRFVAINRFYKKLQTVVQWEAFHAEYVEKTATIEIPRWQSSDNPYAVKVTDSDGSETTVDNIIGFIHDRDALGMYRKEQEVLTTPINARGRYVNTFWHEEQMWFNDLSENGVIFTLS